MMSLDDKIIELALGGNPPKVIAKRLGIPARVADNRIRWARRKGIALPKFRKDLLPEGKAKIKARNEAILDLAKALRKPGEIAAELGVPKSTVIMVLLKARRAGEEIPCLRTNLHDDVRTMKIHRGTLEAFVPPASARGISDVAFVRLLLDTIAEEGDTLIDAILDDGRAFIKSRAAEVAEKKRAKSAPAEQLDGYSNLGVSQATLRAGRGRGAFA